MQFRQKLKIRFKITGSSGTKANTTAIGHIIKDDYIRRQVRRRSSKVMTVRSYTTKDGKNVSMKVVVITDRKASGRQKAALKKITEQMCVKLVAELDSKKLVDELVFGTPANKIYPDLKKIIPIKRIELANSSIL